MVKKSVSLPEDLWEELVAEAEASQTSVSSVVSDAVAHLVKVRAGQRATRQWEREHGEFGADELAEADRIFDDAGVTPA